MSRRSPSNITLVTKNAWHEAPHWWLTFLRTFHVVLFCESPPPCPCFSPPLIFSLSFVSMWNQMVTRPLVIFFFTTCITPVLSSEIPSMSMETNSNCSFQSTVGLGWVLRFTDNFYCFSDSWLQQIVLCSEQHDCMISHHAMSPYKVMYRKLLTLSDRSAFHLNSTLVGSHNTVINTFC